MPPTKSIPKKTIYIQCSAKTHVPLEKFRMMPQNLKDRKREHVEKLANLIIKHGFLFPFFVWQPPQTDGYVILDGHGRYNALKFLEKKGYTIPDVPIVVVQAKNEQEAKKKLLEVGNMNGLIDFDQFETFTKDLELDLSNLYVPNVSDVLNTLEEVGFYPGAVPPGMCVCPKCNKHTFING